MLAQKPDSDGKLYYRAFVKAASTESATCQIEFADEEKPNMTPPKHTVGINDVKDLGPLVNKVVWSKNMLDFTHHQTTKFATCFGYVESKENKM